MRTELFDFHLPEELIATRPPEARDAGRMCVVLEDEVQHDFVRNFADQIREDDLVVLNETRVRRARLICERPRNAWGMGGAQVEILFLHPVSDDSWVTLGKANRPLRVGDVLLAGSLTLTVSARGEGGTLVVRAEGDVEAVLEEQGYMPIPPYMQRAADEDDVERYQTVFARELGSAAAPTAGLHVTEETLARIGDRGARVGRLILHVGIGTFRPVTVEDLNDHPMHEEWFEVSEELVAQVNETRERGGRVIAVGTTAVRALESSACPTHRGRLVAARQKTRILIQPEYEFRVVDALLTNFHMPKSTLLALVSAFVGRERVLSAYEQAVSRGYRFLSYGDAMWIPGRLQ